MSHKRVAEIKRQHHDDMSADDECFAEIETFMRGGDPGFDRLNRVYPTIMKHFDVNDRRITKILRRLHVARDGANKLFRMRDRN